MNINKFTCQVPFGTVSIRTESIILIEEVLKSRMVTNGKYVKEFEESFAKLFNKNYAVAVNSGTAAVTHALASLYSMGAKRGDEVILPALTFVASANAIIEAGFKPVFVDVHTDTLLMNIDQIPEKITDRTCAILAVHLMGKVLDIQKIKSILPSSVQIVEDTAEAHGAKLNDSCAGTQGIAGCFSLYAAHIITSIEGGIVITDDEEIYNRMRSLRNHGLELQGSNWTFEHIGFSSKMNELEAIVGLGNVNQFNHILETRRRNFNYLTDQFIRNEFTDLFTILTEEPNEKIGPHAFSIILKKGLPFTKAKFINFLNSKGIDNRNLFYSIPTQSNAYKYLGHKLGDFPESEHCSNNGTHIGIHQDLTIEQLDYVINSIKEFLNG